MSAPFSNRVEMEQRALTSLMASGVFVYLDGQVC